MCLHGTKKRRLNELIAKQLHRPVCLHAREDAPVQGWFAGILRTWACTRMCTFVHGSPRTQQCEPVHASATCMENHTFAPCVCTQESTSLRAYLANVFLSELAAEDVRKRPGKHQERPAILEWLALIKLR